MTDETETQETPKPKRFYESAKPEQIPGGWTVELDGRSIKTPARVALKLPTEKL
ncbi:MAG TPA: ATPase, partial [Hyphomonas sp.]|nr:ATPase [Hyphomonas sp.]